MSKFVNAISRYQIAYSDGTTNKYYNTDKTAIGIITYVHQNKDRKHGIMMSLPAFTIQNQAEARKICAAYTTAGTMPGDWHLPDLAELTTMSAGDEKETNNDYTMFRDALKTIPTAGDLEWSFSFFYENSIGSLNNGVDKKDTTNTQGNWAGHTFYNGGNTNWYTSPHFLSASQYPSSNNVFVSVVNSYSGLSYVANSKKMQFRCVAEF